MKRIIGLFSLVSVLCFAGCTDKPAEVRKEVIVVPAQPVIVVKEPADKNTTVTLDKNGVKVVTKKVDITVKKQ